MVHDLFADGGDEPVGGLPTMPGGDADEVQPLEGAQRSQELDGRDRDPARHDVPRLFDGDGDAHPGRATRHDRTRPSAGSRLVL